jgi:uncharacterized coiled-coil DUF342 family protein
MSATSSNIITALTAAGAGGGVVALIRVAFERKKIGADATAVITATARDLVATLNLELDKERKANAAEVKEEREKVRQLRKEMELAIAEARELRAELRQARLEADALRREVEEYKQKNHELEIQLRRKP